MATRNSRLLLLSFFVVALAAQSVSADFGIPRQKQQTAVEEEISGDGSQQQTEEQTLSQQDAIDIEALLLKASQDPDTVHLIAELKGAASSELDALRELSPPEILGGLKQTVDDMKVLDYLFQDGSMAFEEMNNAGMIGQDHVEKYKNDPALLEEDTRRGLYFQFVSLALVGGLLE